MARAHKRHVQQDLFGPRGGMRVKNGRARTASKARRGKKAEGKVRRGPGRPPKGKRAGSPHKPRPELNGRYPVHVVLRAVPEVGSLRKRFMYQALRDATLAVAIREIHEKTDYAFRIVHISIQRTHVHLLVEAANKRALSRGLQGFQISAAKHINRMYSAKLRLEKRRRGSVFPDRYHAEIIETPKQARNALSYVLNNWRKHREDRGEVQRTWKVDPYSSGALFAGWKELEGHVVFWPLPLTYQPMIVYLPQTWLLRVGWQRHGLIRTNEVPRAAATATARPRH
jgi:putative transposase